jgi:hypothetical protein
VNKGAFDRILIVDWSAAAAPSPRRPSADAIWTGLSDVGTHAVATQYHRTRSLAQGALTLAVRDALDAGQRLLIGADFPFGFPTGFAAHLTGHPDALRVWDWLARHVVDGPDNRNNRFHLADRINAGLPGVGPFWGRPAALDLRHLPAKGRARRDMPFPERRLVEAVVPRAQPVWKLFTTGSVGSQMLTGLPVLQRLRARFAGRIAVWPFEDIGAAPVVLTEVYPSLLAAEVATRIGTGAIKDAVQVCLLSASLCELARRRTLGALLAPDIPNDARREEGWILGASHQADLREAAANVPPISPGPDPGGW